MEKMTELKLFIDLLERENNIFKLVDDPDEEGLIIIVFEYNSSNPQMVTVIDFDNEGKMAGTIGTIELDDEGFEEFVELYRQSAFYDETREEHWGRTMEYRYGKPNDEQALEILEEVYGADSVQYHAYESMIEDYYYDGVYAGVNGKDIDNRMLELFYQLMK